MIISLTNKEGSYGDVMDYLNNEGINEKEFLKNYNPDKYKKPAVTVDMLIFTIGSEKTQDPRKLPGKKLKLLMIKRGNHPYINQWALPGGFVDNDEGIDDAAKRELLEETGINADYEGIYMEQLYTWGQVDRDPRMRVVSVSYISLFNADNLELQFGDDAKDAEWFEVCNNVVKEYKTPLDNGFAQERVIELKLTNSEEVYCPQIKITKEVRGRNKRFKKEILDSGGIAFDHPMIIECGLGRLRKKIEYTDLAFNLMPDCFTLTELQQVYETIIGRKLLKANFRRKIDNMVVETGNARKEAAHRPAKLYRYNPDWDNSVFD